MGKKNKDNDIKIKVVTSDTVNTKDNAAATYTQAWTQAAVQEGATTKTANQAAKKATRQYLKSEGVDKDERKAIAKELNQTKTASVSQVNSADYGTGIRADASVGNASAYTAVYKGGISTDTRYFKGTAVESGWNFGNGAVLGYRTTINGTVATRETTYDPWNVYQYKNMISIYNQDLSSRRGFTFSQKGSYNYSNIAAENQFYSKSAKTIENYGSKNVNYQISGKVGKGGLLKNIRSNTGEKLDAADEKVAELLSASFGGQLFSKNFAVTDKGVKTTNNFATPKQPKTGTKSTSTKPKSTKPATTKPKPASTPANENKFEFLKTIAGHKVYQNKATGEFMVEGTDGEKFKSLSEVYNLLGAGDFKIKHRSDGFYRVLYDENGNKLSEEKIPDKDMASRYNYINGVFYDEIYDKETGEVVTRIGLKSHLTTNKNGEKVWNVTLRTGDVIQIKPPDVSGGTITGDDTRRVKDKITVTVEKSGKKVITETLANGTTLITKTDENGIVIEQTSIDKNGNKYVYDLKTGKPIKVGTSSDNDSSSSGDQSSSSNSGSGSGTGSGRAVSSAASGGQTAGDKVANAMGNDSANPPQGTNKTLKSTNTTIISKSVKIGNDYTKQRYKVTTYYYSDGTMEQTEVPWGTNKG